MIRPQASNEEKEKRLAGTRRVRDWVEEALPEEEQDETTVMVNQIECKEEGCELRRIELTPAGSAGSDHRGSVLQARLSSA